MKEKLRVAFMIVFGILFVWFFAGGGDLLENFSTTGGIARTTIDLLKQALPSLLTVTLGIFGLILLANFDGILRVASYLFTAIGGKRGEDTRLTTYRKQVRLDNLVGTLRVFCGGVGLMVLLADALAALVKGTEFGLFAGSIGEIAMRFGKFAFFLACLLGLFPPWRDYWESNARECQRRKEELARIEQDPDWWRKRDEEQREREKQHKELEAWHASLGHAADEPLNEALRHPESALATLTRQIRDYKSPSELPRR